MSAELEALLAEARDPNTEWDRLEELVDHPEVEVRRAVLDNLNLCPLGEDGQRNTDLLKWLTEHFPEEVASHPLFVLHALIEPNEEFEGVVGEVARRTKDVGLIERLWTLWGPSSWSVRQAVAQNPNTPENILRTLGTPKIESDWQVRQAVAQNPNAPVDILRILGNQETESHGLVRWTVAKNPSTPPDLLRILCNQKTEHMPSVRGIVAENPSTPVDVLRSMTNLENERIPSVRAAAEKALVARGLT